MLSLAKLRVGQEAHQLSGVAESLDDSYTGAGEASGRWAGIGAERLGAGCDVKAFNTCRNSPRQAGMTVSMTSSPLGR